MCRLNHASVVSYAGGLQEPIILSRVREAVLHVSVTGSRIPTTTSSGADVRPSCDAWLLLFVACVLPPMLTQQALLSGPSSEEGRHDPVGEGCSQCEQG